MSSLSELTFYSNFWLTMEIKLGYKKIVKFPFMQGKLFQINLLFY